MTSDGLQALDAISAGSYAALLTDCHMPNMDGYQLTTAVRDAESINGGHMPIIAITANALEGEGDRCLDIGMDDYLVKPLEMDKLEAALCKWVPVDAMPVSHELSETKPKELGEEPDSGGVINPRALMDIFGDDDATFKEILLDFIEPSENIVTEIMQGFEAKDALAVGTAAHKLKSSARAVGANTLADLCAELETNGKAADWPAIEVGVPKLDGMIAHVTNYIKAL